MDLSRRDFIRQVGVGKAARLLGGLLGLGIFGSFGIVPEGSPDEAARELALKLARKTGRVAPASERGAGCNGGVSET
jgi:hypothetical protein